MINELLQQPLAASRQLVMLDDVTINRILTDTDKSLNRQRRRFATHGPGKSEIRSLEIDGRTSRRYCRRYEERRLSTVTSRKTIKRNSTTERYGDPENNCPFRRDRCHLRSTPERHLRCFFSLPQKWECLRTEGRFRC